MRILLSSKRRRRLKRGLFRSVVDPQAAINRFLAETNAEPKPFTWTADPDKIIAGRQTKGTKRWITSTGLAACRLFEFRISALFLHPHFPACTWVRPRASNVSALHF
jgi:hypothetical protein